jgi:NADH-quinone oxidoreductase subunit H
MIKLFFKEDWIPPFADKPVFSGPAVIMITVLMSFAVIPWAADRGCESQCGPALPGHVLLGIQRGSGRPVVKTLKYALIGGLAGARMLSYEVFGIVLMGVVLLADHSTSQRSSRRSSIVVLRSQVVDLVISDAGFAETHRLPFDLPSRGRACRRVSHQYSGMKFGMFFVGEYLGITLISA